MPPTLLILGPTASGKSALALALAERLGGVCIGADSMQVYRGMDIGTAKPTAEEQARVPHELIDLVEPDAPGFTVDRWLALAHDAVERTTAAGRWPIVVGGTNLYVKAFVDGLFDGPAPDPALRAELASLPREVLRRELEGCDPDAARRIHPNDQRRTIRALEVFRQTGVPISQHQQQWDRQAPDRFASLRIVGLEMAVETLNRRINARVRAMMDAGLLDEVRRLWAARRLGVQAREALGYRELIDHLEGRVDLEEAVERIKIGSRRFAKQQRTWLRRFRTFPGALWTDATAPDLLERVLAWLGKPTDSTPAAVTSSPTQTST